MFVSYPADSVRLGRLITGQRLETAQTFHMVESSQADPSDPDWKEATRERVENADAVLAVLTRHSDSAEGQRFELEAARDNDKPRLGVQVYADDPVPPELDGSPVTEWTWEAIIDWIDSLPEE